MLLYFSSFRQPSYFFIFIYVAFNKLLEIVNLFMCIYFTPSFTCHLWYSSCRSQLLYGTKVCIVVLIKFKTPWYLLIINHNAKR